MVNTPLPVNITQQPRNQKILEKVEVKGVFLLSTPIQYQYTGAGQLGRQLVG
jgi:hypothetical protein